MSNITGFVSEQRIRISSEWADFNPAMDGEWAANHYRVTLKRGHKRMTLTFSKGFGLSGEPTAEEVLSCLADDAAMIDNCVDFEDFCSELGYDADSRKAERIYNATLKQSVKLEKFLGSPLFRELVWNTERE